MRRIESACRNENWIKDKYIDDRLTIKEMATLAGVSHRTMLNWMIEFGVDRRTHAESIKGEYTGENAFFYGRHHSKETRSKISKNHADVGGENNPMYGKAGILSPNFGKPKSKDTKKKLSKANRGRHRPDVAGPNNHWWKGGRTSLMACIRSTVSCIEWRNSVFKRDSYTCQDCGDSRGGNLNAHHLEPLAILLDKYNIKILHDALSCKEIWDVSNGITVCKACHTKRHNKLIRRAA